MTIDLDNLATPGMPVWRKRARMPLTNWAVRCDIINQSADLPGHERASYVSRRLTALDRALTEEQALAVEVWLRYEDLLNGAAKISSYGDRSHGSGRGSSPIPDAHIRAVGRHVMQTRRLKPGDRHVLHMLAALMAMPDWDLGHAGWSLCGKTISYHQAKHKFIAAVKKAAQALVAR